MMTWGKVERERDWFIMSMPPTTISTRIWTIAFNTILGRKSGNRECLHLNTDRTKLVSNLKRKLARWCQDQRMKTLGQESWGDRKWRHHMRQRGLPGIPGPGTGGLESQNKASYHFQLEQRRWHHALNIKCHLWIWMPIFGQGRDLRVLRRAAIIVVCWIGVGALSSIDRRAL